MNILAIDNSTNYLSLAYGNMDMFEIYHYNHQNNASEFILSQIKNLIKDNIPDYIAVGIGPGGFTGVRLACSTAMGLSLGFDKKIIPICSLNSALEYFRLANSLKHFSGRIVIDARMNEVYSAKFSFDKVWHLEDIGLFDIDTNFNNGLILSNLVPDNDINYVQPHALGILSLSLQNTQHAILPQNLIPNYVRNKVAYTIAERKS